MQICIFFFNLSWNLCPDYTEILKWWYLLRHVLQSYNLEICNIYLAIFKWFLLCSKLYILYLNNIVLCRRKRLGKWWGPYNYMAGSKHTNMYFVGLHVQELFWSLIFLYSFERSNITQSLSFLLIKPWFNKTNEDENVTRK